ncbi:MAG: GNAT family N-acetyltransferase [Pseudomonadota bacterium]
MYKLIKAQPVHASQIIPYLTITCYWKEFSEGNNLNQSYEDFMLEWVINDRLPYTTVLVKEENENIVCGCIIVATTEQFGTMPDYTPHVHPRVMEVFAPWFGFPVKDGVLVELIALDKDLRGQGYGSKLYEVAEALAVKEKKNCLSAFVWSCFPDSLITFTRKGFMVTDCIQFPAPVAMPLLYMQKDAKHFQLKDYFQSEEYLNCKNLLLNTK